MAKARLTQMTSNRSPSSIVGDHQSPITSTSAMLRKSTLKRRAEAFRLETHIVHDC